MSLLYKSTASQIVMLKVFLSSDHVSAATGKTVAITISKNGGAFGNPNAGATNATEVSSGWYKVTLDATDTATEGDLVVRGTAASCDDSERVFRVHLPANFGVASIDSNGRVDVIKVAGTTQTAGDIIGDTNDIQTRLPAALVSGRMDSSVGAMAANVITAAAAAADFGAEMATALWTDTVAGDFTVAASVGKSVMNGVALGTGLTIASVSGAVGSVTGAVGSVTGAVGSVTGNVGGNVTGSVGSVVGAVGSVTGAVGSVTGAVGSVTGNVGGNVVGSVGSVTGLTASDVGAIKTKTDQLIFTKALELDVNLQSVNGVTVNGDGAATPMGV